jgi:hypothetical protein
MKKEAEMAVKNFGQKPIKCSPIKEGVIKEKVNEGKGSHSQVFDLNIRIGEKEHVVKVGEWRNYRPPIIKALKISLSRRTVDKAVTWVLGTKSVGVYPTPESTKRAYKEEYKLIKKYLSPADKDNSEKDPRQELSDDFKNPQSELFKKMQSLLGDEESAHKLGEIFERHKNDDFLKDEQLVIGLPRDLSKEKIDRLRNKGKHVPSTYYIFQEKVTGDVACLSELNDEDLKSRSLVTEKLITLALLQRKMYKDTGKLMDTRPDELIKSRLEWFQKTDNILVDKNTNKVFFIDTRWLWDSKTRFIGKNWLNLIDHLGRKSVDRAIKKYVGLLNPASSPLIK